MVWVKVDANGTLNLKKNIFKKEQRKMVWVKVDANETSKLKKIYF